MTAPLARWKRILFWAILVAIAIGGMVAGPSVVFLVGDFIYQLRTVP